MLYKIYSSCCICLYVGMHTWLSQVEDRNSEAVEFLELDSYVQRTAWDLLVGIFIVDQFHCLDVEP